MSDVLDQLEQILDEDELDTTGGNAEPTEKPPESDDELAAREKEARLKEIATNGTELDELELDERIYDGGPTRAEVEGLKAQFPNSKLLCVLLADGYGVLYRTVTRREWKAIQKLVEKITDPDKREEIVFSKIVLHPDCSNYETIGEMPAGVVISVMQEFYLHSGFQPVVQSMVL